jgi:predicted DNA-binding transcriptional regulator YafY
MEKEHLSIIEEAIKGKKAISFKYLKPNDQLLIFAKVMERYT